MREFVICQDKHKPLKDMGVEFKIWRASGGMGDGRQCGKQNVFVLLLQHVFKLSF